MAELGKSWGIGPDVALGHSLGEYVAACIAGVRASKRRTETGFRPSAPDQALPEGGATAAVFRAGTVGGGGSETISGPVVNCGFERTRKRLSSLARRHAYPSCFLLWKSWGSNQTSIRVAAFHSPLIEPMIEGSECCEKGSLFVPRVSNRVQRHGRVCESPRNRHTGILASPYSIDRAFRRCDDDCSDKGRHIPGS